MADAGFIYHSIGRAIGVPEHMSSLAHHGEPKSPPIDPNSDTVRAATATV
jgi:hypothetical protein